MTDQFYSYTGAHNVIFYRGGEGWVYEEDGARVSEILNEHAHNCVVYIQELPELQKRNLLAFLDSTRAKPWSDKARRQHSSSDFYYVENGEYAATSGKNWARRFTTPYVVAVVLEASMKTPLSTIDGYQEQGTTLGYGIEGYISRHARV